MSASQQKPAAAAEGRAHETRITIDAPVEAVWRALTDPEEISRWFAPRMTVKPGAGGHMVADWGPGVEWKTFIEVWEPNRHLRLVETRDKVLSASPVDVPLDPRRLVQDFFLESEAGRTVLRLVHSGFGSSADWDTEYEGTRGGWAACFFRLKQVWERHRRDTVHNICLPYTCHGVDDKRASRMIEEELGSRLTVEMRHPYEFCGTLADLNGSILSVSVQPSPVGAVAYIELLLFGLPDAKAAAVEVEWKGALARLFPQPVAA